MYYKVELSNGQILNATSVTPYMSNRDMDAILHLRLTVPMSLGYDTVKNYIGGVIESAKVSLFKDNTSPSGYITAPQLSEVIEYLDVGADASVTTNAETSEYEIYLFKISEELKRAREQSREIGTSMELICELYEQTLSL